MKIRYAVFDRFHEWTINFPDLDELEAIRTELTAFDQATRDELLGYAEGQASEWKKAGEEAIAGLWERFAEEVRRAGQG